ncbi:uncharacterized protein LTR77_004582 [Saxophila tyrrhenica]|uniref:Uncharacterized protein n=1 Tax=Saxophila tyrrhenica TaxID=1690608 RepID=A0AAV9PEB0_9PEZI|nr:hypothetical protein LTR77_004582 [Saxophila tyrrhenica]
MGKINSSSRAASLSVAGESSTICWSIDQELTFSDNSLYNDYAVEPKVNQLRADGKNPLVDLRPEWMEKVTAAIMSIPAFQKAVVEEHHCPGLLNFAEASIENDWVVSVYLRGFYDCFAKDDDDAALAYVMDLVEEAKGKAKSAVELIIKKHAAMEIKNVHQGGDVSEAHPLPPKQHQIFVARLLDLSKHEKELDSCRQQLYTGLMSIPKLNHRTPISSTVDSLRARFGTATMIDSYGEQALSLLLEQVEMTKKANRPVVVPVAHEAELDVKVAAKLKQTGFQALFDDEVGMEDDEQAGDPSDSFAHDPEVDTLMSTFDPTAEEGAVRRYIESSEICQHIVFYPVFANPDGAFKISELATATRTAVKGKGKASKKGKSADELVDRPAKRLLRKYTGFKAGRFASRKEWEEAAARMEAESPQLEASIQTSEAVVQSCLQYIDKNPLDFMDIEAFKTSLQDFLSMTARNEDASSAEKSNNNFIMFSPLQLFDNWWHCRCYLAVLRIRVIGHNQRMSIVDDCEFELAVLLSLVRVGAEDPLLWLPVVDFALRKLWRRMTEAMRTETFIRNVFNELTLFMHGAVVNAFVLRCEQGTQSPDRLTVSKRNAAQTRSGPLVISLTLPQNEWYPLLFQYQNRCANEDCRCLLPDPSVMKDNIVIRGMLSFGTDDARVGNRGVRTLVSSNRTQGYPCLYSAAWGWSFVSSRHLSSRRS